MITLATLPQATEQEIFDQVVTHLITQGRRSISGGTCLYRSGELKCAAGCLIADDEYLPEMDYSQSGGSSWNTLADKGLVPQEHKNFIRSLQSIHDSESSTDWEEALIRFASQYGLNYNFPVKTAHAV